MTTEGTKQKMPKRKAPKAPEAQETPQPWNPSIVVFACNWCSYAGADTAGVSRIQHQPHFRMIRVMCSGRIQPGFVLRAFEKGADGVLVSGCHLGDCHYIFGNERAIEQFDKTKDMVELLGIDEGRLRLEWISAAEGGRFAEVIDEFTDQVRKLGRLENREAKPATGEAAPVPDPPVSASQFQATKSWACYDCGKCTATCPISRSGSDYSPRRHVLATNLGQQNEILKNGDLYSCLTCSLCDQRCPAQVAYTDLVLRLRELSHSQGVEPECPHGGALQSVMRMMATGNTQQNRMAWLTQDLKTQPVKGETFYWTGCTMYYDAFFPDLQVKTLDGTRAAVRIMNRTGDTPVVSPEERCCGHDLLWNGDRKNFEALARHNVKLVAQSGARTLVVSCAECLRTWKKDYAPYFEGEPPRIIHVSQYIGEHLGQLRFKHSDKKRVTYQDPCRLSRHLGTIDAPRRVLSALPGVELAEMRHHGLAATCCAGGTWSNCDRFAKKIQVDRLREARATGAETLVTACPKCQVHFRCTMNDPNIKSEITIEMRDVAELAADALE